MSTDRFYNDSYLITGATGLIGSALVKYLISSGKMIQIIVPVRNVTKAKKLFGSNPQIKIIESDVTVPLVLEYKIDYIVHAASQTSSMAFVDEPVETIHIAYEGTKNLLELAKEKKVKSFIYLSSMEVYGAPETDEIITETHSSNIDTMTVRSSYPESKRLCEALCTAYWSEFGVPVKVIRLTQTFGPGVAYDDGRVFAEFARCVIEKRDIVLHTKGETKRSYLYIDDAVSAIFTVLLYGKSGEAYNAANEETYCSIFEMAKLVAERIAEDSIRVLVEDGAGSEYGYAPILKMNLRTQKLKKLGWEPHTDLEGMFRALIRFMKSEYGYCF